MKTVLTASTIRAIARKWRARARAQDKKWGQVIRFWLVSNGEVLEERHKGKIVTWVNVTEIQPIVCKTKVPKTSTLNDKCNGLGRRGSHRVRKTKT
jgi:hypothetical protein